MFCVQNTYGQQIYDTIKIKNFLGDFNFKINNQRISRSKLIEYTERNIEANQQLKKSNTIYTLNFIPSIASGALMAGLWVS